MPGSPRSKLGLALVVMLDDEISCDYMKDMALGAPMVGLVAAAVVDKAQLDVAEVSGASGGGAGLASLDDRETLAQLIAAIGIFSIFIAFPARPEFISKDLKPNEGKSSTLVVRGRLARYLHFDHMVGLAYRPPSACRP